MMIYEFLLKIFFLNQATAMLKGSGYWLSGGIGPLEARSLVRETCWQKEGALNIGPRVVLLSVSSWAPQATCWGWLLAVVSGDLGPSIRRFGYERARRRVRRVVGVGVELPRHDGEVHAVVTDDDAVLELRVCRRACHAQAHPKTTTPPWCSTCTSYPAVASF